MRRYSPWDHSNLLSESREKAPSCLFLSVTYMREMNPVGLYVFAYKVSAIVNFLEVGGRGPNGL